MVLAIDPGHIQSAYVVYAPETEIIVYHGIMENEKFLYEEMPLHFGIGTSAVIEMIQGMGMAVGKEVFETVFWIGRIWERLEIPKELVYRKDIKLHLCGTLRAKDSNIRQALIDRFGGSREEAIGRKSNPGPLYGIRNDEWQALACALYFSEKNKT